MQACQPHMGGALSSQESCEDRIMREAQWMPWSCVARSYFLCHQAQQAVRQDKQLMTDSLRRMIETNMCDCRHCLECSGVRAIFQKD